MPLTYYRQINTHTNWQRREADTERGGNTVADIRQK
jgi:hypothetical protein